MSKKTVFSDDRSVRQIPSGRDDREQIDACASAEGAGPLTDFFCRQTAVFQRSNL